MDLSNLKNLAPCLFCPYLRFEADGEPRLGYLDERPLVSPCPDCHRWMGHAEADGDLDVERLAPDEAAPVDPDVELADDGMPLTTVQRFDAPPGFVPPDPVEPEPGPDDG